MSRAPATILFVVDDPDGTVEVRGALAGEPGLRVIAAPGTLAGLDMARFARPDLVVLGGRAPGPDDLELGRSLREEPGLSHATLVLVTPPDAATVREAALRDGFDAFLNHPVAATDVLALLHLQLRLRRAQEQLRADGVEMDRLQKASTRNLDEIVGMLAGIADLGRPGAAECRRQVGDMARRLALRFGVPAAWMRDMEVAAQVHELGSLATASAGDVPIPPWRRAVSAAALLERVDGLQGAAGLLRGLYENWDGTGFPEHLIQGQIPLRCRILRVALEYRVLLDGDGAADPEQALALLATHAGTLYDPMVLVHLRAMVAAGPPGGWRADRRVVPVTELRVGMVLAEDLCTDSGLKLLARGTRLSPAALHAILRRHTIEPMLQGATVLRRAA